MYTIETTALTKDYALGFWRKRPYRALDALSLQVSAGELFGFLGPNGAGKTTTLKLLMQLVYPTSGDARILGRPVGDLEVRRRIGYLPEQPYFYDHLTAEELLHYYGKLFGLGAAERKRRVDRLLDEVGLGGERRMPMRRYSKGMLQRVGLAQALINDPEVVFLDEPMSGLDPIGRRLVRTLMLGLRERGVTVFFSSHILADAEAICSRVAIVAGGRLVSSGSLSEILAFDLQGWDLVVDGVGGELRAALESRARRVTQIAEGRLSLELPPDAAPERVMADVAAAGGRLVSLNPMRETLEDYFMRQVREHGHQRTVRP